MAVSTTNLPTGSTVTELVGNREQAGVVETVRIPADALASQLLADGPIADAMANAAAGVAANYETRAGLYGDLAHAAGSVGKVWGDSTADYRGIYLKAGASGAGSWSKIGPLPEADTAAIEGRLDAAEDAIDAVEAEIATARNGAETLTARLEGIDGAVAAKADTTIATTAAPGLMSAADKSRLNSLAFGGGPISVNATGPLADRDNYDAEQPPFTFLATDQETWDYYIRDGASGNWVGPISLTPAEGAVSGAVQVVSSASRTVQVADDKKITLVNYAGDFVLNLPDDMPIGHASKWVMLGPGLFTVNPYLDEAVLSPLGHRTLAGQYSSCLLTVVQNLDETSAVYLFEGDTA